MAKDSNGIHLKKVAIPLTGRVKIGWPDDPSMSRKQLKNLDYYPAYRDVGALTDDGGPEWEYASETITRTVGKKQISTEWAIFKCTVVAAEWNDLVADLYGGAVSGDVKDVNSGFNSKTYKVFIEELYKWGTTIRTYGEGSMQVQKRKNQRGQVQGFAIIMTFRYKKGTDSTLITATGDDQNPSHSYPDPIDAGSTFPGDGFDNPDYPDVTPGPDGTPNYTDPDAITDYDDTVGALRWPSVAYSYGLSATVSTTSGNVYYAPFIIKKATTINRVVLGNTTNGYDAVVGYYKLKDNGYGGTPVKLWAGTISANQYVVSFADTVLQPGTYLFAFKQTSGTTKPVYKLSGWPAEFKYSLSLQNVAVGDESAYYTVHTSSATLPTNPVFVIAQSVGIMMALSKV